MNCPRCENRELTRIWVADSPIDQCNFCEGIWFDRTELANVLDQGREGAVTPELAKSLEGEIRTHEEPGGQHLSCPRCQSGLKRYYYGYSSKVLVDGCESSCGVWIDDGELAILFEYAAKAAADLDPQTQEMINQRLDDLALARKEREEMFVDTLVTLDDKQGPYQGFGVILQALATAIHKAQKKLF